ncbi:hypothetical protein ACO0LG_07175 [Undibacterium sp. Ji42W]|uniref:hypothetical protein n=1 Tax=Undibacterium sp. Ji42W TaxID=3413039 RepID=UPI003BF0C278
MQIDQIALLLIIPNALMLLHGLRSVFRRDSGNTVAACCLAISLTMLALVVSVTLTYSWAPAKELKDDYFAAYLPASVFTLIFTQHIWRRKPALWQILLAIFFSAIIFCIMAPYAAILTACACGDCL